MNCFKFILFLLIFSLASLLASSLTGRDLISIEDLTKEEIELVLSTAQDLKKIPNAESLKGKILATCFFEPSTRTRLSFESAMHRLGGKVIGFSDSASTSTKKGESLADTMKTVSGFADVIVIRHPEEGSAQVAAKVSNRPVINGGDGANQHPTQTLIDLFSIQESQGKIDGLHIALVGDLKYGRTIHSLCCALMHYDVHLSFVAPQELPLPEKIYLQLQKAGISCSFHQTIEEIINDVDVLYMTRIQKERFSNPSRPFHNPCLLKEDHLQHVKSNLKILHPLPRVDEIETAIDDSPYAYYFQQAANGVPVRMALLHLILGK